MRHPSAEQLRTNAQHRAYADELSIPRVQAFHRQPVGAENFQPLPIIISPYPILPIRNNHSNVIFHPTHLHNPKPHYLYCVFKHVN